MLKSMQKMLLFFFLVNLLKKIQFKSIINKVKIIRTAIIIMQFMKANYHTHTVRCHHAKGSEREYIEKAIEAGYKTLGFADHSPYFFDGDYYSHFRMRPEEAEQYVRVLQDLRQEYSSQIDIKIGFEAEYYPKYFERLRSLCRDIGIEYLILGQHYTCNETDGVACVSPKNDRDVLNLYVEQMCEGIETGAFSYVAHPDVINLGGGSIITDALAFGAKYESERTEEQSIDLENGMRRICRTAKKVGIPLEINLLGLRDKRFYPTDELFRAIAKEDAVGILGCDAHSPEGLNREEPELQALEKAKLYSTKLTDGEDLILRQI